MTGRHARQEDEAFEEAPDLAEMLEQWWTAEGDCEAEHHLLAPLIDWERLTVDEQIKALQKAKRDNVHIILQPFQAPGTLHRAGNIREAVEAAGFENVAEAIAKYREEAETQPVELEELAEKFAEHLAEKMTQMQMFGKIDDEVLKAGGVIKLPSGNQVQIDIMGGSGDAVTIDKMKNALNSIQDEAVGQIRRIGHGRRRTHIEAQEEEE